MNIADRKCDTAGIHKEGKDGGITERKTIAFFSVQ